MRFFKLFLLVFVVGSLFGVSCNLKSIEETQEAAKSPSQELLTEREADLAKREAESKKREAALEDKKDEEEEPEESVEDGEELPDKVLEDQQDDLENLNERKRKVLNEITVETGDNNITILLVAGPTYDGLDSDEPFLGFGCDDLLIPLKVELEEKTQSDLATAVVELLLTKRQQYRDSNGLVNHISGVGFTLVNVSYQDGKRIVDFEGEPITSGTCESPRITSQIEETVALYSNSFEIRLNGSAKDWRCLFDVSDLCE